MADSTTGSSRLSFGRRGQQRNHYTTVKMAPCRVCGGTSTGYHFGVVSCEACKAFFRRAMSKQSYGRQACQKGNDCASTPSKITSCCSCRLKRCLEEGMSKDGARRGRYSIELRTKSILDAQRVEKEGSTSKDNYKINKQNQTNQQTQERFKTQASASNPLKYTISKTETTQSGQIPSQKTFPWKQKSDFFKFSSETHESRDCGSRGSRDSSTSELTNEDCSIMKAICEGYSFCQSPDCAYVDQDDILQCVRVQPSPGSGSASNCSTDVLENVTDFDPLHDNSDNGGKDGCTLSNSPNSLPEVENRMEILIQKLVHLQGALYPHHRVTEDILLKQKIIEDQHHQREEAFLCMFGSNEYTSTDEFQGVLSEVNIELDDRLVRFREKARANESSIVQYIYHSKFIPGFKQLDKQDVSSILKASYSEFWLFSNFATMNKDTGVSGGTDVVINGHKKVIKTFFPREFVDDMFAFANSLQKLQLTLEEVALIRVIVLTFIDRCPLKYPEKVDRLNQLFLRCLQYYLSKSVSNPRSRFYKIFDRLIAVRSLMHRNKRVNEDFLKEWGFLMTDFPLWKEMMISQIPNLQKNNART